MSLGLAGAVMNVLGVMSKLAKDGVGGATAVAGMIPAAIQFGRNSRKAFRAAKRAYQLQELLNDENMPAKMAMKKAQEVVPKAQEDVRLSQEILDNAQSALKRAKESQDKDLIAQCEAAVAAKQEALAATKAALEAAKETEREKQETFERVKAAVAAESQEVIRYKGGNSQKGGKPSKGGKDPISLLEIQRYAAEKNWRGTKRKALTAVSGALGVGGSVFAIIAITTLGAAFASNPVGWGIAAAAAAAALSVVAWKGVNYVKHRWDQTAPADGQIVSGSERFKKTFQFWKAAAPGAANEREEMAGALYNMAREESDPALRGEARRTIEALGLTWAEMAEQGEEGKKLIAAKFASG
jgi:hypothetical protein